MNETFNPENKEKLSKRVLVAEDTTETREMLCDLLESQGFKVDAVENGQLLLNNLFEGKVKYDLVITDNNMPTETGDGITGIEVLKKIRGKNSLSDLPVVVFSGDIWIEKDVERLGGTFLSKPDILKLQKITETILG